MIKTYITTEVFDRDGKLRYKRKRRSKSFVKAFLAILLAQMNYDTTITGITDVGGTDRDIVDHAASFRDKAGATGYQMGVVVGTGTTAVTASDYKLETQIVEGTGTGQLSHQADTPSSLSVSDPNVSFTIHRDFLNQSGATITVNEEGLYLYGYDAAVRIMCVIRDVETTGVAVADGENLRVTYTLQTST